LSTNAVATSTHGKASSLFTALLNSPACSTNSSLIGMGFLLAAFAMMDDSSQNVGNAYCRLLPHCFATSLPVHQSLSDHALDSCNHSFSIRCLAVIPSE